jgi:hypothetical protein
MDPSKWNPSKWSVWRAAAKLEESASTFYPNITPQVVSILRLWASKWDRHPDWRSLLNKSSLHHELEESIIAIHHLLEATSEQTDKYIVVDVCGGKGLFSFLLSYMQPPHVQEIILLEKATINWYHIHAANEMAKEDGRPWISIWSNTNLNHYDDILDRLASLPYPVAMTGIHLCKQLSPSFCGLVNGLGPRCIYACLAPCCLPRAVTAQKNAKKTTLYSVSIQLRETADERHNRKDYTERRERLKRKPNTGPCFLCKDETHGIKDCPIVPTLAPDDRMSILKAYHAATVPCWNCLEFGHYKCDCPDEVLRSTPLAMEPPALKVNVSQVLKADRPFPTYCHLLAESLQSRECRVIETGLQNLESHQDGNWNSGRKAIFIVVT